MNPIILALDFPTLNEADDMLTRVRPHIGMIKIGLELFTAHGWECARMAAHHDIPIFLDLKLYDIPTTVKRTVEVVCSKLSNITGPHFLSIHCLGAKHMCREAMKGAHGSNVKITGITILSSFDSTDLREVGYSDTRVGSRVVDAAWIGREAWEGRDTPVPYEGLDHFVCPPAQLNLMRKHYGDNITLITPGIRQEGNDTQEHSNAKPASFALKNKANWLVIGRPITRAPDPEWEAKNFASITEKYAGYNKAST